MVSANNMESLYLIWKYNNKNCFKINLSKFIKHMTLVYIFILCGLKRQVKLNNVNLKLTITVVKVKVKGKNSKDVSLETVSFKIIQVPEHPRTKSWSK